MINGEKMVEVSELYNLSTYTIAGEFVGRIEDVVLNMRLGTISKLQIMALDHEKKDVSLADIVKNGFKIVPDDDESKTFKKGLVNVDYDKVKAIGDIMLIDPQGIEEQKPRKQEQDII